MAVLAFTIIEYEISIHDTTCGCPRRDASRLGWVWSAGTSTGSEGQRHGRHHSEQHVPGGTTCVGLHAARLSGGVWGQLRFRPGVRWRDVHPELFGKVLSQSGAFWRGNEASNDAPYEWITQHLALIPKANVRFVLDVGSMETMGAMGGAAPSLVDANRRLRDVLKAKGYAVDYFEVPGGQHSTETWRTRLPAGI